MRGSDAKRMAYHIVKKMDGDPRGSGRGNPKKKGWFDERKHKVESLINTIMTQSVEKQINIMANKHLNKKI